MHMPGEGARVPTETDQLVRPILEGDPPSRPGEDRGNSPCLPKTEVALMQDGTAFLPFAKEGSDLQREVPLLGVKDCERASIHIGFH